MWAPKNKAMTEGEKEGRRDLDVWMSVSHFSQLRPGPGSRVRSSQVVSSKMVEQTPSKTPRRPPSSDGEAAGGVEGEQQSLSSMMRRRSTAFTMQRRQSSHFIGKLKGFDEDDDTDKEAAPGYYTSNRVLAVSNRVFQTAAEATGGDGAFHRPGPRITGGALKPHTHDNTCLKKTFPGGFAAVVARQERFGRDTVNNSAPTQRQKLSLTQLDNNVDTKPSLYFRPKDIKMFRKLLKQQEDDVDANASRCALITIKPQTEPYLNLPSNLTRAGTHLPA